MLKKTVSGAICLLLICGFAAAFCLMTREERGMAGQLSAVNEQAAPYQRQILDLYEEIDRIEQGEEDGEGEPTRIIYGYFAETPSEIAEEGAIVLNAGADEELVDAARATGREIIYFFLPKAAIPQDRAAVVFRTQNDTEENRRETGGVISRHIDSAGAGVSEDGSVLIPYIYNKNDDSSIEERLNSSSGALLVIFNPGVTENLKLLKSRFENRSLTESTVAEAARCLQEAYAEEQKTAEERESRIRALKEEISELQKEIDTIYQTSQTERMTHK